jgi:hypothetical protein
MQFLDKKRLFRRISPHKKNIILDLRYLQAISMQKRQKTCTFSNFTPQNFRIRPLEQTSS